MGFIWSISIKYIILYSLNLLFLPDSPTSHVTLLLQDFCFHAKCATVCMHVCVRVRVYVDTVSCIIKFWILK